MKIDQLRLLVPQLRQALQQGGKTIKVSKNNTIVVDQDHFFHVPDKKDTCRIVMIDGGNQEILGGVNYSLQMIRVAACVYENKKQISNRRDEMFCLTTTIPRNDKLFFTTRLTPKILSIPEYGLDDSSLAPRGKSPTVSMIPEVARRFAELDLASKMIDVISKGDVVVLDGLISPHYTGEEILVESLLNKAKQKQVSVIGFAKTTRLMTESGSSAMEALAQLSPGGCWRYSSGRSKRINTHFVRLHDKSKHVFRIEVPVFCEKNIDSVLANLKAISADPIFLGYPYGLIAVDRIARVSNREKEYLKMALQSVAGYDYQEMAQSMKAIDAHQILDSV